MAPLRETTAWAADEKSLDDEEEEEDDERERKGKKRTATLSLILLPSYAALVFFEESREGCRMTAGCCEAGVELGGGWKGGEEEVGVWGEVGR